MHLDLQTLIWSTFEDQFWSFTEQGLQCGRPSANVEHYFTPCQHGWNSQNFQDQSESIFKKWLHPMKVKNVSSALHGTKGSVLSNCISSSAWHGPKGSVLSNWMSYKDAHIPKASYTSCL